MSDAIEPQETSCSYFEARSMSPSLMRAYARQAKKKSLEADAWEIRMRAERRVGELIAKQKETVGLNAGAKAGGKKESSRGSIVDPRDTRPTLEAAGIDKHLADRARKLTKANHEEFERRLVGWQF